MTRFAFPKNHRTSRAWIGIIVGLVLLAFLLPMSVHGQNSVQSLIEQGQKSGADADLMRTVATRAQEADFSAEATTDLLQPAVALAERDLPSSPILNKILEGLAKQVPPARMTPVLQQLQSHTQQAGALVSSWMEKSEVQRLLGEKEGPPRAERNRLITNIAEAQQQDLPLKHIEKFLNDLPGAVQRPVPPSKVATAVSVMPDLPAVQENPALSQQLLTAALNAGYDAESLRQLPVALEQAQRTSQRPAPVLARGAAQAISRGTPATSVLRSLFQGSIPSGGPPSGVGNGSPETPPGQGKPPGKNGRPPGADPPAGSGGDPSDSPPVEPPGGG